MLSAYEYWYPMKNVKKLKPDWLALEEFPIHAKRDKDYGMLTNILRGVNFLTTRFLRVLQKMLTR
jgi:hypothetical protein